MPWLPTPTKAAEVLNRLDGKAMFIKKVLNRLDGNVHRCDKVLMRRSFECKQPFLFCLLGAMHK